MRGSSVCSPLQYRKRSCDDDLSNEIVILPVQVVCSIHRLQDTDIGITLPNAVFAFQLGYSPSRPTRSDDDDITTLFRRGT